MNEKIYLAYGSNLNLEQMSVRCPKAKVLGTSTLKDYKLLFRGWRSGGVATVEPSPGDTVPVLLWSITPACEAALDRYEGFPRLYRKETVTVELNGERVEAMVYIMNGRYPLAKPGCGYYSTIREGYKTAGFDIDILNKAVDSMPGELE